MAVNFIEHTAIWFEIKNPLYKIGEYTKETDTGITKQGLWDGISKRRIYYNDLLPTIVNTVGVIPVSAGGIPTSGTNGTFKPIPFTGVVDGSNPTFTLSNSATDVMVISDTQPLLIGLGYTVVGLVYTIINPPVNGIIFWGNY